MKHLFSCLKAYRKEAILAPFFKLLEACMELTVPLVVAAIINTGLAGEDRGYLINACLLLVAFGALGLLFALTAQYFAAKAAVGTAAELRLRLFKKLQSFSYAQIDEMGAARMITRMTSDVNQVQTGVNMTLRLFLRSPFIVFGAMAMALVVDSRAGLVFVGLVPLLALAVYAVMGVCLPLFKKVQERLEKVYLSTRETLAGVRVIRAFSLEESEKREFEAREKALKKAQKRAGALAALSGPLTYALVNLALIVLLSVGAFRVNGGALQQGDVVALYGYLAQILVELIKLANLIVTITKAISCQRRIGAVLDMEGEPSVVSLSSGTHAAAEGGEESAICAVSFKNVSFSYAGGGKTLNGITFSARKGETVGILGGTGAGKSTLVNLIPRFYECTEGEVRVCGENVDALPAERLREKVGVVPQRAVLFKGTIRSNLLWGNKDATEEELLRAVRLAQAEDVVSSKGGLDGEIAQEGKNLSGGQRQRLTIARALVKEPEILILDDSSSALDYATDKALRHAIRTLGCTVFLVSQRATSLMHADQILVLDDGKLVGRGTHESLLEGCEVYREIYRSQVREEAR